MIRLMLVLLLMTTQVQSLLAEDWPQWMGPARDGVWSEDGILAKIPQAGLKKKWSVKIAGGYSGPAVADGRVFVMDFVRKAGVLDNNPIKRNMLEGHERVLCFDATNGKELWKHESQCKYSVSYACGPRCTPTVTGGNVYTLGAMGHLNCINAKTGKVIWSKDLEKEYKTRTPLWGFSSHPLVHGDSLICVVGGEGSTVVAFNKDTGRELWKGYSSREPGYCPPTIYTHHGKELLFIWHATEVLCLDPKSGQKHWSVKLEPMYGMSVAAPRLHNDHLFVAGMGGQSVMLQLRADDEPKELWRGTRETSAHPAISTPLIHDKILYSCDSFSGSLHAIDLENGKRLWESSLPTTGKHANLPHGNTFIVRNQDRFFLFSETGELVIAHLTREKYEEISRCKLLEPTGEAFGRKVVWSHPAFANRSVYARNDEELNCHSLEK